MRENRPYGSEGGVAKAIPTPIMTALFAVLTTSFNRSARNFVTDAITRSPARFEAT